jgi:hypothetical protein
MPWGFTMFADRHNENRFRSAMYRPEAVRQLIARFQRLLNAACGDFLAASRWEVKAMGQSL